MIHLCIDARLYEFSGLGRYIKSLIPFFVKNEKIKLTLLVRKNIDEIESAKQIVFKSGIYSIKEHLEFYKKVPPCDIFFSPHYNVPLLPIRAKKRVVTIHDLYHLRYIDNLPFMQKIYAKFMHSYAVKKSDKIITISTFTKNEMQKLLKLEESKLSIISNGIDAQFFSKENAKIDVKSKYNLPKKYFLFVGNLREHKNLKRLIKAFKKLAKEYVDYYFIIIGNITRSVHGEDLSIFEHEQIKLLNNVQDAELLSMYKNAFAFVFPSYYEGFGYPPLEAMCLDVPTVVSTAASIPEVCGKASLFFNPFDENDIYKEMKKLIEDKELRELLISRGRERVNKFSLKDCAEKHMNLFEELSIL